MLFQLRAVAASFAPGDVLRLLMNPLAGNTEPLGRRVRPLGVFVMGTALTSALELAAEENPSHTVGWRPLKLRLRWRKAVAMDSDPLTDCRVAGHNLFPLRIRDATGELIAKSGTELSPIHYPDALG
jgi:hypothetical protein